MDPLPSSSAPAVQHVVIVDDDVSWGRLLTDYLESRGESNGGPPEPVTPGGVRLRSRLRCHAVTSGRHLLAHLKSGLPCDAVVLDLCLPDLHGLQVLEMLQQRYPRLPVVLHSGSLQELWGQRGSHAPVPGSDDAALAPDTLVARVTKSTSSLDEVHRELRRLLNLVAWALHRTRARG